LKEEDISKSVPGTVNNPPEKAQKPRKKHHKKPPPTAQEEEIKRSDFLERNRKSAYKCRSKRKGWAQQLEEDERVGRENNADLKLKRRVVE